MPIRQELYMIRKHQLTTKKQIFNTFADLIRGNTMESKRQNKVAKLIQKELAEILRSFTFGSSKNAMITVSQVRISPDLSSAKVYLSIFTLGQSNSGKESIDTKSLLLEDVVSHKSQIRKQLGLKVGKQLRIVPELLFYLDDSLDYEANIDDLLKGN